MDSKYSQTVEQHIVDQEMFELAADANAFGRDENKNVAPAVGNCGNSAPVVNPGYCLPWHKILFDDPKDASRCEVESVTDPNWINGEPYFWCRFTGFNEDGDTNVPLSELMFHAPTTVMGFLETTCADLEQPLSEVELAGAMIELKHFIRKLNQTEESPEFQAAVKQTGNKPAILAAYQASGTLTHFESAYKEITRVVKSLIDNPFCWLPKTEKEN